MRQSHSHDAFESVRERSDRSWRSEQRVDETNGTALLSRLGRGQLLAAGPRVVPRHGQRAFYLLGDAFLLIPLGRWSLAHAEVSSVAALARAQLAILRGRQGKRCCDALAIFVAHRRLSGRGDLRDEQDRQRTHERRETAKDASPSQLGCGRRLHRSCRSLVL